MVAFIVAFVMGAFVGSFGLLAALAWDGLDEEGSWREATFESFAREELKAPSGILGAAEADPGAGDEPAPKTHAFPARSASADQGEKR